MTSWKVRGLQLDLARQMEPVSRIIELLDLCAEVGLTHVQLYLEGRVRLPCFPGPIDGGAYSGADLAAIAEHARRRGLQLIPVVPALGHAELILSRPELLHLAEEREGRGRFHSNAATFCPSLPESRTFLKKFCEELCQLLPGTELHLGCDEAWNLGFCSLCHPRAQKNGLASLYIEHVTWLHELTSGLGRRLWLWDDFFELFPEALTRLPKDICWSHWSYDEVIDPQGIQAHFVNRRRHRWLEQYSRHGAETVVVPWALAPRNVESLIEHGRAHPSVIGAMLSEWEMAWRGWDERRAVVRVFAALCRNQDLAMAWDDAIACEAPELSPHQRLLAKAIIRQLREPLATTLNAYLRGPISTTQHDRAAIHELALATLGNNSTAPSEFIHGIRVSAELDLLTIGLQEWVQRAYDPRRPEVDRPLIVTHLNRLLAVCESLGPDEDQRLRSQRPGCLPQGAIASQLRSLGDIIRQALDHLNQGRSNDLLIIRYVLPDAHGLPSLMVELQDNDQWHVIFSGSPKPDPRSPGSWATQAAILQIRQPQRLRISGGGYGGISICWCEIVSLRQRWIVDDLISQSGPILMPLHLKNDDSLSCQMGDAEILPQLLDTALPPRQGMMEWSLCPVE